MGKGKGRVILWKSQTERIRCEIIEKGRIFYVRSVVMVVILEIGDIEVKNLA